MSKRMLTGLMKANAVRKDRELARDEKLAKEEEEAVNNFLSGSSSSSCSAAANKNDVVGDDRSSQQQRLEEKSEEEVTMMFEDVDHQAPQDAALFFPADDEFEKDQESEKHQESEKDLAVKRVLKKEKEKQANDDAENTYTFDVFDEDYSYWPPNKPQIEDSEDDDLDYNPSNTASSWQSSETDSADEWTNHFKQLEILKAEEEASPYRSFNIMEISRRITDEILDFSLPEDDKNPLQRESNITKGDFCRDLHGWLTAHGLGASKEAKDSIVKLLFKNFKEVELPLVQNRNKNFSQNLDAYAGKDLRHLSFHCCKSGCAVYEGVDKDCQSCGECGEARYHPCTKEPCASKTTRTACNHKGRIAVQNIYYRPILPLIALLLKTKGFLLALNYVYSQPNPSILYGDLSLSINIQNHLRVMKIRYEERLNELQEQGQEVNNENYVFVPILFSKSYDGVQVYSSKQSNFHPLLLSIINLPPSYRNKSGNYNCKLLIYIIFNIDKIFNFTSDRYVPDLIVYFEDKDCCGNVHNEKLLR
jgi:hypothetical protein